MFIRKNFKMCFLLYMICSIEISLSEDDFNIDDTNLCISICGECLKNEPNALVLI